MKISSKEFVCQLFQFQLQLKMYHWQTYDYGRHKATDNLMSELLSFTDLIIEGYMGKYKRVETPTTIELQKNVTDKNVVTKLLNPFIDFLKQWKEDLKGQEEFLHLIDDIQLKCEQTKYLMTLK